MDQVEGAGAGANIKGMDKPSSKEGEPFSSADTDKGEGAETDRLGGSELGSGASSSSTDTVDLSSSAQGSKGGDESFAQYGNASSYDAGGEVEDEMDSGASQIDAMI